MKRREDERGHLVRVYEPGDGMRRRFYDALEDARFSYPRKAATHHALAWYCDGHLKARPVSGLWTCATLAEHLLALSRERGVPALTDAARYYASTRRALKSMLAHYRVTTRLTRKGVEYAGKLYAKLCREGTEFLSSLGYLTPLAKI